MPSGVYVRTEEHKRKIGLAQKGKIVKHSEETKIKIGLGNKGKIVSEESRLKMSLSHKGKIPWNKGIPHSEETKRKMSKSRKGRIFTEETLEKLRIANMGEKNPSWNGGRYIDKGYIYIYKPEHPNTNSRGYIYEHRLIMEKILGRYLMEDEVVHHKNKIKDDNNMKNLMLFPNSGEHMRYHKELGNNGGGI